MVHGEQSVQAPGLERRRKGEAFLFCFAFVLMEEAISKFVLFEVSSCSS